MNARWYASRLRRMSAAEAASRAVTVARQWWWAEPARRPDALATLLDGPRAMPFRLHRDDAPDGPAADAVLKAADALIGGHWRLFQRAVRLDPEPDWFHDPLTGRTAPRHGHSFRVRYRDEACVGNIKFVWELSRHQPATLLACAWWLSGRDAYAERAADHLRSWWRDNPFLEGAHWVSGIEAGLRLLSWSWIAALLAEWRGAPALFTGGEAFARQLYHHSLYLSAFRSAGSSANNHVIAELAGLAAASTAFPWFRQSARWAARSRRALVRQAVRQTHPDGWNREQASAYHLFVLELLIAAALPSAGTKSDLADVITRMADALAASLDSAGNPPRFGDSDDARGLLVDDPDRSMAAGLLDAAAVLAGPAPWWPAQGGSVLGSLAAALHAPCRLHAPSRLHAPCPPRAPDAMRPALFPACGMAILRRGAGTREVWVRCDAGPHGYLSIAAHGHADALSVELRVGGVEVLADPGTYCYHGEPAWRAFFQGTPGHNTLTIGGQDQAVRGGPFLWLTRPRATLHSCGFGAVHWWEASHDGYRRLHPPATHRRRVTLDVAGLTIRDWVEARAPVTVLLAFHLGPRVTAHLTEGFAHLAWPGGFATMQLPAGLTWRVHFGDLDPPLGWYSPGFGRRIPAAMLAGRGVLAPGTVLETVFGIASA